MRKLICVTILFLAILPFFAMTRPRVYVQKLVLDNGKTPFITFEDKKSANEYILTATILEIPGAFLSTEIHPVHSIAIKQVGNGTTFPYIVIASVQLGNFGTDWQAEQTLHLELTHKLTGQKYSWDVFIPEGTALMKHLDDPLVIPPYTKKKH